MAKSGTIYLDKDQPTQALNELANSSTDVLYQTSGVFPFDFWPDTLKVSHNQIEITYRNDPFTRYVYPMPIEKILTVRVHKGLFLAELEIEVEGHEQDPSHIKYLKKSEAEEVAQLILGLKIANNEEIDLSEINRDEIVNKAKQISISDAS